MSDVIYKHVILVAKLIANRVSIKPDHLSLSLFWRVQMVWLVRLGFIQRVGRGGVRWGGDKRRGKVEKGKGRD